MVLKFDQFSKFPLVGAKDLLKRIDSTALTSGQNACVPLLPLSLLPASARGAYGVQRFHYRSKFDQQWSNRPRPAAPLLMPTSPRAGRQAPTRRCRPACVLCVPRADAPDTASTPASGPA